MAVWAVVKLGGDTSVIVVLQNAIKSEGPLGVEDAGVNIACFMAGVVVVHASKVAGRRAQ